MTLRKTLGGEGVKARDIKDVEKKTHDIIKALLKIQDELIGSGPVDGLVPLARIMERDSGAAEFRQTLDRLVARLFSVVDSLQKQIGAILTEPTRLAQEGHEFLLIRYEGVLIENLRHGFVIVSSQLAEMQALLDSLPGSADKEQLALQVTSKYVGLVEELKWLSPIEERLENLYKMVDGMV